MKPEVAMYKRDMKRLVPEWRVEPGERVSMKMSMYGNWLYKNGKIKKLDVQNLIKVVVDLVSERMGFNDSQVYLMKAEKVQCGEECVEIEMERMGYV